jgi:hypothetical protein
MLYKKIGLILILFYSIVSTYGQENKDSWDHKFGGQIEYAYFKWHSLSIGGNLLLKNRNEYHIIYSLDATANVLFDKQKLVLGEKIGLGCSYYYTIGPNVRISAERIENGNYRLTSEAGISLFSAFNINYGYSIPLNSTLENNGVNRHRIMLTIKINKLPYLNLFNNP